MTLLPGEKIEKVTRREHWQAFEARMEDIRHKAKLSSFWYARLREAFEAGFEAGRKADKPEPDPPTALQSNSVKDCYEGVPQE